MVTSSLHHLDHFQALRAGLRVRAAEARRHQVGRISAIQDTSSRGVTGHFRTVGFDRGLQRGDNFRVQQRTKSADTRRQIRLIGRRSRQFTVHHALAHTLRGRTSRTFQLTRRLIRRFQPLRQRRRTAATNDTFNRHVNRDLNSRHLSVT